MLKNQEGFHLVAIMLVFVVLGVVGFAGFKVFSNNKDGQPGAENRGASYQGLPACGQQPLTKLPADLSKLEQIGPLGNVDPPDHTMPTDHMYMMYPYGDMSQKEIYAPADIVITAVSYSREIFNGTDRGGDYRIDFYPCNELKVIYGHVDVLNEKIKAAIGTPESPGSGQCNTSTQATSEITNCMWDTDIKLSAGELLGTANGWDLWATYEGSKGKVLSQDYYHNTDAVCPLDYWAPDLQAQLYTKVLRTAEPRCGQAYQDKSGTLQGGWFAHKDPNKAKTDWSSHFSLTHHSVSNIGQVAVAGTIADQFMYNFTPKSGGTVNVEPSKTVKDTLYCYQHEGNPRFPNGRMAGTGKILLKMSNDHTMLIEHKPGSCTANESLSNPTTYYR
jgi:hypothetical protein